MEKLSQKFPTALNVCGSIILVCSLLGGYYAAGSKVIIEDQEKKLVDTWEVLVYWLLGVTVYTLFAANATILKRLRILRLEEITNNTNLYTGKKSFIHMPRVMKFLASVVAVIGVLIAVDQAFMSGYINGSSPILKKLSYFLFCMALDTGFVFVTVVTAQIYEVIIVKSDMRCMYNNLTSLLNKPMVRCLLLTFSMLLIAFGVFQCTVSGKDIVFQGANYIIEWNDLPGAVYGISSWCISFLILSYIYLFHLIGRLNK